MRVVNWHNRRQVKESGHFLVKQESELCSEMRNVSSVHFIIDLALKASSQLIRYRILAELYSPCLPIEGPTMNFWVAQNPSLALSRAIFIDFRPAMAPTDLHFSKWRQNDTFIAPISQHIKCYKYALEDDLKHKQTGRCWKAFQEMFYLPCRPNLSLSLKCSS